MKIDKNDFITLSDNIKYLVASKVVYMGIDYLYLVDIVNDFNIKVVAIVGKKILEVNDSKLLDKILKSFIADLKKNLDFW